MVHIIDEFIIPESFPLFRGEFPSIGRCDAWRGPHLRVGESFLLGGCTQSIVQMFLQSRGSFKNSIRRSVSVILCDVFGIVNDSVNDWRLSGVAMRRLIGYGPHQGARSCTKGLRVRARRVGLRVRARRTHHDRLVWSANLCTKGFSPSERETGFFSFAQKSAFCIARIRLRLLKQTERAFRNVRIR